MFMFPLNVHTVQVVPNLARNVLAVLSDAFRDARAMERDAYRRGLLANR